MDPPLSSSKSVRQCLQDADVDFFDPELLDLFGFN